MTTPSVRVALLGFGTVGRAVAPHPDRAAARRRAPDTRLRPRRRAQARRLGPRRRRLDEQRRGRLRVRRECDRGAGWRARAGRHVGASRARLGPIRGHREQAAHRARWAGAPQARRRAAASSALRSGGGRRHSGDRRAARRHRRRPARQRHRHPERHVQLHPDEHGRGRVVCGRAQARPGAGVRRSRSDRRRRGLRRAREAGHSLRRRAARAGGADRDCDPLGDAGGIRRFPVRGRSSTARSVRSRTRRSIPRSPAT